MGDSPFYYLLMIVILNFNLIVIIAFKAAFKDLNLPK